MDNGGYFKTTKDVRKALKRCKSVYVAIMCGNMTWSVSITKEEAKEMLRDIDRNWKNCEELGVSAIGYLDGPSLHLGGL